MAHFAKTRLSWGVLTALLSSEMAAIDVKTYKAVNGDEGGTWAPSSAIEIGGGAGGGLTITGASTPLSIAGGGILQIASGCQYLVTSGALWIVDTDATFGANSDVAVNKSFTFENGCTTLFKNGGTATFNNGHTSTWQSGSNFGVQTGCHASISLDSSSTLYVGSGATFTVHVDADAVIALGATASLALSGGAPLTVGSGCTATIAAGATLAIQDATVTLAAAVTTSGKGRVRCRPVIGADANTTYHVENYDLIHVQTLTASRTYTLGNTGAATGDRIRFSNRDATYGIDIQINGGGTDVTIKGGVIETVDYTYIGGTWYRTGTDKI